MSAFRGKADIKRYCEESPLLTQSGHCGLLWARGEHRPGGRDSGYSPVSMARSSRKRIALSLLLSEITKRTRPCFEVSA